MKKKNKKNEIDNFVLPNNARDSRKYIVPFFGFPMLLLLSLFLWISVFRYPDNVIHWVIASGWFLFVIALTVYFYTHRTIDEMQYHIGEHTVTNTISSKIDLKLNLFDPLHISHISITFYYGKGASETKEYYLFGARPFSNDDYKGDNTLSTLEHFHKKGIIIFPKKKKVDEWLRSELKINDIPEFPRSVIFNTENQFGNGIDSDIGLTTDG